jgi:O-succinylbenzoate synthase
MDPFDVGPPAVGPLDVDGPDVGSLDPSGVELVRLWRVAVPLRRPFVASHGVEARRASTLVEVVRAGGACGWGECPALERPTYTGEYAAGAWRLLADELVPATLAGRGDTIRGHPMARFAVESALTDASLRESGTGLAAALAGEGPHHPGEGRHRRRLERTEVIDQRGGVDQTLAAVTAAADDGARLVKLKIEPGADRQPLRAVRATFPDLALAADANGSYAGHPVGELRWVDDLRLVYLEQPYPVDDLLGHRAAASALRTPVALDESVASLGTLAVALELGALGALNVKPARLGGLAAAVAAIEACARRRVPCFVGGMLELGVGRAAAAAVAALPTCTLPTDLGPSERYVAEDITDPIVSDADGRLVVPDGPGLGVGVRPDRLAAVALDVVELRT